MIRIPLISAKTPRTKSELKRLRIRSHIELCLFTMMIPFFLFLMLSGDKRFNGAGIHFTAIGHIAYWLGCLTIAFIVSYWFVWRKKLYPINLTAEDEKELGL